MRSLEAMSHAQIREPLQIRSSESLTAFVRVAVLGDCPTGAGPIKSHRNTFEPDQIRLVIRHLTALRGGPGPTGAAPTSFRSSVWLVPDPGCTPRTAQTRSESEGLHAFRLECTPASCVVPGM